MSSRVLRLLGSVRLALALILLIVVLSVLASLVPQGRDPGFYRETLPPWLAGAVLAVGFDRFTRSPLYLAPVALFVLDLGVCTVNRIASRRRRKAPPRHGPDLIHASLLLLAAAGAASGLLRRERAFTLAVGESARISGGVALALERFDFLRYDSGAPRDWVSTVRVTQGDRVIHEAYPIEVNHPLRVGLLAVYQTTWDTEAELLLADAEGAVRVLAIGQGVRGQGSVWRFAGVERLGDGGWAALLEELQGSERLRTARVAAGGAVGGYRVESVQARELTGLTAVRDPGAIPALAALALGGIGLALTFIQRKREAPP